MPPEDTRPEPNVVKERHLVIDLFLATLLGTIVGLLFAAIGGALGGWAAGLVCGLSFLGLLRLAPRADVGWFMFLAGIASGVLAGLAWWPLATTPWAWYVAPLIGGAFVAVFLLLVKWRGL